jgi:uncharacterized protein
MPAAVARAAVGRAVASLRPDGLLELAFFGGEPLLEAPLIRATLDAARAETELRGRRLACSITTNGTVADGEAWTLLADPAVDISVSHDGLAHDRHRPFPDGRGSVMLVEATLRRLVAAGRDFNVVVVVRPDTLDSLPASLRHLRDLGAPAVEPSLDLWTLWSPDDVARLRHAVERCADFWRDSIPRFAVGWFDEQLARIAELPLPPTGRCGFGDGQIAVAPSGNLYPCERLIGEDAPGHPARLPGHALDGVDFVRRGPGGCDGCPCSNFVRTGSPARRDDLLRELDRFCFEETTRVIGPVTRRCFNGRFET